MEYATAEIPKIGQMLAGRWASGAFAHALMAHTRLG